MVVLLSTFLIRFLLIFEEALDFKKVGFWPANLLIGFESACF